MEDATEDRPGVAARPQEQLLIDSLGQFAPTRVVCTSQGLAQLATAAAERFPQAAVQCHYLDLYRAEQARRFVGDRRLDAEGSAVARLPNLTIACSADFPEGEVDLAALPMSAQGEAELTRELLQAAHQRLAIGGSFITSTDNPRDKWLHEELQKLFDKVVRKEYPAGAVYVAWKDAPLKRVRNFVAEFAFRDGGRLIHACSRPGVFSHRKVDPGARQLMNAMQVRPGDRVLDLGCGSGLLALAVAFRAENVSVLAVDSHARAVECTARSAALNGLTNIAVEHSATGPTAGAGTFDLALENPPYYAGFRIARFMVEAAHAALRKGGWLVLVTKRPEWYEEHLPQLFAEVRLEPSKEYWIVRGRK